MHKIEWTDKTWNVISGCTQISPACENCYAKAMTKRLQGMAKKEAHKSMLCEFCRQEMSQRCDSKYHLNMYQCLCRENNAIFKRLPKYYLGWDKVVFHKESLNDILDKKKYPSGSKIFVNSMSDTFHENISDRDLVALFDSMVKRKDLTFQVLTKRADRMLEFFKEALIYAYDEKNIIDDLQHIWFGVTAENQECADKRIPQLLELKRILDNKIKCFVSLEPLLSEIDLASYLDMLDWVIVGGENIPNNPNKARLMKLEWVESIYDKCKIKDVPFFFKQLGNTDAYRERIVCYIERCKEFPYQKEWIVEVSGCGSSNFYEKVEFDTQKEALAYRANEYVNRRIFHKDTNRLAREHREKLENERKM
ncbi:DUF5131 family protein [Helicobacter ganmani]|uniref:DUF5131 family protein n=1 Tax=Helicobacter ganmani TaxID=60246 RepID=UPI003A89628D